MQDYMSFIENHLLLSIAVFAVIVLILIIEFLRAKHSSFHLDPLQTTQMINHNNAVVVDIRPQDAYKQNHIIGAYSMSVKDIQEMPKKLEKFKNKPIILVCAVGTDSQKLASDLIKKGYNTFALHGGIRAWNDAQMPLVKEK